MELVHHGGLVDFVVTFDDVSYKMGLGNQVRTFLAQTVSDVVSAISSEYGLQATVDSTTGQLPYLIQAGSDLELLGALAEQTGYDWWVDQTTLHFSEPVNAAAVASLALDDDLLDFTVRATAIHPGTTTVSGWATKRQAPAERHRCAHAGGPAAGLRAGHRLRHGVGAGRPELAARRLSITVHAGRGRGLASSFAQRWVSQAVTARGLAAINPAISVGTKVTITNAGPSIRHLPRHRGGAHLLERRVQHPVHRR